MFLNLGVQSILNGACLIKIPLNNEYFKFWPNFFCFNGDDYIYRLIFFILIRFWIYIFNLTFIYKFSNFKCIALINLIYKAKNNVNPSSFTLTKYKIICIVVFIYNLLIEIL